VGVCVSVGSGVSVAVSVDVGSGVAVSVAVDVGTLVKVGIGVSGSVLEQAAKTNRSNNDNSVDFFIYLSP